MDQGEVGTTSGDTGTTRRRARSDAVLSVILLVTLTGFAISVYCGMVEVDEERETLRRETVSALSALSARVGRIERDVDEITDALPPDVTDSLIGVAQVVDDLGRSVSTVRSELDRVRLDVDGVRSCVNAYMDTIGRWSGNVASRYSYFYC